MSFLTYLTGDVFDEGLTRDVFLTYLTRSQGSPSSLPTLIRTSSGTVSRNAIFARLRSKRRIVGSLQIFLRIHAVIMR